MTTALDLAAVTETLHPPVGEHEILHEFGDVYGYVSADGGLDARWQAEFLARVALPFPLLLSWDHSKTISEFSCHRRMVDTFEDVFAEIQRSELQSRLRSFGGCFSFRPQRTGHKLSTHCWGIAIDLNPETNGLGTAGDMDRGVVAVFREAGFTWGGGWLGRGRDPMHFQFCSGY